MGNSGLNGSGGNGHDREEEHSNVTRFPTEAERREREQERAANDAAEARRNAKREPIFNLPPLTKFICFILIAIHLGITGLDYLNTEQCSYFLMNMAFIPARYVGEMGMGWQGFTSPITHMFFHGGWVHLGVNVIWMAAFGGGFEKELGSKRLLLMFFITGVAGALTHFAFYSATMNPLIGASGGISGVMAGTILMIVRKSNSFGTKISPWPFIFIWIAMAAFFGAFGMPGAEGEIAWATHIGGFIAGLLLYKLILKLKI